MSNETSNPAPSHFSLDTVKTFTGKMQFRTDGSEKVHVEKLGDVVRGAVVAVKSEKLANSLAAGGSFAHVAADTPLGVPVELRPASKATAAAKPGSTPATQPADSTK